jgi:glycosyltransferase involved in cell wall biosynthesis
MIFYPVAMGRYILDALLRRKDVEVWSVGPYTGRWIPWGGGMNLPEEYVFKPNVILPLGGPPTIAYATLQPPWEPDLWIEANAALNSIGRPKCKYAVVATDPHVVDYRNQRANADLFFNMQKPYMAAGDIWLPYAYDPIHHAETTVPWERRQWDASLLGLQYESRIALVNALRARGRQVHFRLGPAYEEARSIYHDTRVGLNWSSAQDTTARVFELMAFGLPSVLNRVPDLMELFHDGEHFLGFHTLPEAVGAVERLLADPDFAVAMGHAAREAVRPHTWDARVHTILQAAGLVSEDDVPDPL